MNQDKQSTQTNPSRRLASFRVAALALGLAAVGWILISPYGGAQPTQNQRSVTTNQVERMHVSKPSDDEIVLTRAFAAPRQHVFDALTQAKHLTRWMTPTNMALVACEFDARVGGTFRYVFQRPSGRRIEVRGAYATFDPPRRFEYTETYDFSPLKVQVTTTLDEMDGQTVFRQRLRYSSMQERDGDFGAVAASARQLYANLDRYLAQDSR